MRNKGFFTSILVILALICFYYFGKSLYASRIETKAQTFASTVNPDGSSEIDLALEKNYLDSIAQVDSTGFFTYKNARKNKLNLGLDLKGGLSVILEIVEKDILLDLANHSENPVFRAALTKADEEMTNSQEAYRNLFFKNFEEQKVAQNQPDLKLSSSEIFNNARLSGLIATNDSDQKVQKIISSQIDDAIAEAKKVIETRVDNLGVSSPVIHQLEGTGRINVELAGLRDTERVKKLLQSTAKLEFFTLDANALSYIESLNNAHLASSFEAEQSQTPTAQKEEAVSDKNLTDSTTQAQTSIEAKADVKVDSAKTEKIIANTTPKKRLLEYIGEGMFVADLADTARVNGYLKIPHLRRNLTGKSRYTRFSWEATPDQQTPDKIRLYALQGNNKGEPTMSGDIIAQSKAGTDQYGKNNVNLLMTLDGARQWAEVTGDNVGRLLAIVLDHQVYSAPVINQKMDSGNAEIAGNFSVEEANDLANVLSAGKMPASAKIIQAEVVGPSLGKESIQSGLVSFAVALAIVLVWMIFYYAGAGIVANIALIFNLILTLGILISIHGVLTLPGIAGLVLTIGMAVDANVIIYERIKEELAKGKERSQAIREGYKFALSSILDANITTLLTGVILFLVVQSGPVRGFAILLIIGIITSLVSALILSRLIIESLPKINFYTSITRDWLTNLNVDFLGIRKIAYIVSGAIISIGLLSLIVSGLDLGVDFTGGRTYVVRYEKPIDTQTLASSLASSFVLPDGSKVIPEIKKYGTSNQYKITTKYLIESDQADVETKISDILYQATKSYLPESMNREMFEKGSQSKVYGILSYNKVGATFSDDIAQKSYLAILLSLLVVFLYILLRFRKWQFSVGAVAALFHDVLVVLGIFSISKNFMPFSLEIDQAFIAAILTVIGYSLNDTVIVFDRIREFMYNDRGMPFGQLINRALNTTLSRTVNTSLTTLFVVLIIFIFGGDTIRGFMFALLVGIVVGTYSSLFIASPIMYDTVRKKLESRNP